MMYSDVFENTYKEMSLRVRSLCGKTDEFSIKVEVHQCTLLKLFLFSSSNDWNNKEYIGWCIIVRSVYRWYGTSRKDTYKNEQ